MAAIEAHLLTIGLGKCLEICVATILGWRTKECSAPFLEYWGGYSPPSPPGSYAYVKDKRSDSCFDDYYAKAV